MSFDDLLRFPPDGALLRKIRAKVRDMAGRHGACLLYTSPSPRD